MLDILIFDELSQLTWAHLQLLPRIFHCICMLMYSFNLHLVSAEYISTQLLWNRNTLSIFLIEYSSRTIWCSLFLAALHFYKTIKKINIEELKWMLEKILVQLCWTRKSSRLPWTNGINLLSGIRKALNCSNKSHQEGFFSLKISTIWNVARPVDLKGLKVNYQPQK